VVEGGHLAPEVELALHGHDAHGHAVDLDLIGLAAAIKGEQTTALAAQSPAQARRQAGSGQGRCVDEHLGVLTSGSATSASRRAPRRRRRSPRVAPPAPRRPRSVAAAPAPRHAPRSDSTPGPAPSARAERAQPPEKGAVVLAGPAPRAASP